MKKYGGLFTGSIIKGERRFNNWAGNPKGDPEDTERCIAVVSGDYMHYQCQRKRGHGPDGMFCKQHGKMARELK